MAKFHTVPIDYNGFWSSFTPKTRVTRTRGGSVYDDYLANPRLPVSPNQVRIQDLVKGGAPASAAESCRRSEASNMRPGSRARLRALEAFGFLMLKYAFSTF